MLIERSEPSKSSLLITKNSLTFAVMIEIQRHIEILLLDNDCVIVPGFGGFMAHHVDARYDENDGSFLPPLRSIGFNPQLTMNDSLLVQSYIEAYDLSYPEALKRIEDEVNEIRQTLENKGVYEMTDVGVLRLNDEGNIVFQPCEAGILTPSLYGLSNFNMRPLAYEAEHAAQTKAVVEEVKEEQEKKPEAQPTLNEVLLQNEEEDKKQHLVIPMTWVRNAVAVAAVILAFFLIPTQISRPTREALRMSSIDTGLLEKVMPKLPKAAPTVQLKAQPAESAHAAVKADDKASATRYSLVLASRVTRANAEDFVKKLKASGIDDVRVFQKNGKATKVLYGSYASREEAQKQLNLLQGRQVFEQAWVSAVNE